MFKGWNILFPRWRKARVLKTDYHEFSSVSSGDNCRLSDSNLDTDHVSNVDPMSFFIRKIEKGHQTIALSTQTECGSKPLKGYLAGQGNFPEEIRRFAAIIHMDHTILEIGCGSCEIAWEIATKNPDTGVIATDNYDLNSPPDSGSHYRKVAQAWKDRLLQVQTQPLDNLIVLRAEADILRFLPEGVIDSVLLVNPEQRVGKSVMELLSDPSVYRKIKPGRRQIVVKPFSREMGIYSCGGYEFYRSDDFSRGLGFLKESPFMFKRDKSIQWSVDLSNASPYSKNSTQTGVYTYGTGSIKNNAATSKRCRRV